MFKRSEQLILVIVVLALIFILLINAYSIRLLRSEVYESHYTEQAEVMLDGINEFYIDKTNKQLAKLVESTSLTDALKNQDEDSIVELEKYMESVDEFINYEFISVFDRHRRSLYSDSKESVDATSIIEAYKSLYIDNYSAGIITIPLINQNVKTNNIYFRKHIEIDGESLGCVLLAISGKDIINYMNYFDEVSFLLDPSGEIYLGSETPTDEFRNFIKLNNRDELEKNSKEEYSNFYFDVFDLNEDGWKIIILQSLTQVNFSTKIRVMLVISHILTFILLITIAYLIRRHKNAINSKDQLATLTGALQKTDTKISIVKDDSEVIYSNHEDFDYIYNHVDNLYFKSDILAAIRKERDFEKRYSFDIDGTKKWFVLHLNMLNPIDSTNYAVISLNEFTNERLYQKRLESIALYDQLTGCYNRDQGLKKIKTDIKNIKEIRELAMIFLDIDDLKYVNDNMGHNMGDILIKSIINTVKESVRSNDYCIRIGGDEFLIILPNCSYVRAAEIITMIENAVSTIRLPEYNHKPSFSFGLVNKNNDEKFELESMINEADAKMYINKKIKKSKQ